MIDLLGLDAAKLPPIRSPGDVLGPVTVEAASETGYRKARRCSSAAPTIPWRCSVPAPVGPASDRTSSAPRALSPPLRTRRCSTRKSATSQRSKATGARSSCWRPAAICTLGTPGLPREGAGLFSDQARAEAPPGSGALFFLPYLVGERLGMHRNSRAQFFGITAGHGLAHLHRAILEGVAFAVARHIRIMEAASGTRIERVIASGGGAKAHCGLRSRRASTECRSWFRPNRSAG